MSQTLLLVTAVLALAGCGGGNIAANACDGVTCSGHGTCVASGDPAQAECVCEPGYHLAGLGCVLDGTYAAVLTWDAPT